MADKTNDLGSIVSRKLGPGHTRPQAYNSIYGLGMHTRRSLARLGVIMDFNPVDWLAWVYGKVFLNHVYLGGTAVVVIFGLIGLALWVRGVDRYNAQNPKTRAVVTNSTQSEIAADSITGKTEENHSRTNNDHRKPASALAASTSNSIPEARHKIAQKTAQQDAECPQGSGICDLGDNNTYTDVTNVGLSRGIVSRGHGGRYANTLNLSHTLDYYASTASATEEIIGLIEGYHTKAWSNLDSADRVAKLKLQSDLEAKIRSVRDQPSQVQALLEQLINE